jgi:NADH dehydrogenase FAD-containing subunit
MERKKLVIIGGGFAGAKIAKKLQDKFDVTLIDKKDYFEFTPGILRTIVYPEHANKIEVKHDEYFKKGKFVMGCVSKIRGNNVILKDHIKEIKFDYLVIASGSRYESPIKDDENIIISSRSKELQKYHEKLSKSKEIIIIGGGIVGIELAGELVGKYKDKKIIIVHSKKVLISRNNKKSQEYAKKKLQSRGVEIIFDDRVKKKIGKKVITEKGKEILCDLAIVCTGIKPNSEFIDNKYKEKGFVKVNEFLQFEGKKNVFVCGDVAGVVEEKVAQGAEKQADIVINNILSQDKGKELKKYKSGRKPMVISLGMYDGIFEYKNFVITGFIPAFMKWAIEKKTMMRYGRIL